MAKKNPGKPPGAGSQGGSFRQEADGGLFPEFFESLPEHLQPPEPGSPRARILEAGRTVFAENGFDAASTRSIAELAEVNQAMIHYYYGSKAKLYERILQFETLHLFAQVSGSFSHEMSPAEILANFPLRLAKVLFDDPVRANLLRRDLAGNPERFAELIAGFGEYGPIGFFPRLSELVRKGQGEGQVRDLPPEVMARFLISSAYGLMITAPLANVILGEDIQDPHVFDRLAPSLRIMLRGAVEKGGDA